MKADTAKLMVILGVGTAVVGTTIKEILGGQRGPSFYVPLAGAMVAIPLLVMADFQPDIAGGMAVLIFAAAMTYSGEAIMTSVQNASTGKKVNPTADPFVNMARPPTVSNKIPNPFAK